MPVSRVRSAISASRCACLSRSNGEALGTSVITAPDLAVSASGSGNHRSSQITRPSGTPFTSNVQAPPSGSTSK